MKKFISVITTKELIQTNRLMYVWLYIIHMAKIELKREDEIKQCKVINPIS